MEYSFPVKQNTGDAPQHTGKASGDQVFQQGDLKNLSLIPSLGDLIHIILADEGSIRSTP
jgi:hypothetical protein